MERTFKFQVTNKGILVTENRVVFKKYHNWPQTKHFTWWKLIGDWKPKVTEFYMTIKYEEDKDVRDKE